jgi:hypothetical protein
MNDLPGSPSPIGSNAGSQQSGAVRCTTHSNVVATFACNDCGKAFCDTCKFDVEDGTKLCPTCMTRRVSRPATPSLEPSSQTINPDLARQMTEKSDQELLAMLYSAADWSQEALDTAKAEIKNRNLTVEPPGNPIPPLLKPFPVRDGVMCAQHPQVKATQQCLYCGGFMCPTCDFSFPNDVHLCPTCASKSSDDGLSPRRKKLLIWSFVLAAWTTIGMTCLVSGAFSGIATSKEDTAALGYALLFFVLAPGITGLAVGISAKHARLGNPPAIWIAIVWNAILIASFIVLDVIGLSKR